MTTNMIDMIAKPERAMNKSDKSMEAFSLFPSVPCVALTKKITKNKKEINSVLLIFALLVRSHGTNDTNDWDPGMVSTLGVVRCSHISTNPGSAEHIRCWVTWYTVTLFYITSVSITFIVAIL